MILKKNKLSVDFKSDFKNPKDLNIRRYRGGEIQHFYINDIAHYSTNCRNFSPEDFQICVELTQSKFPKCFIPRDGLVVISDVKFDDLRTSFNDIVENVHTKYDLPYSDAIRQTKDFFDTKTVLVQPTGIQGAFYQVTTYTQVLGTYGFVYRIISMGKLLGVSGTQVIQAYPLLCIAIPATGSLFFSGLGLVCGDTLVGRTANSIGWVLNRPMWLTEEVLNKIILQPFTSLTGVPAILNMTKQMEIGPGINHNDAVRLKEIGNSSVTKRIKELLHKIGTNLINYAKK